MMNSNTNSVRRETLNIRIKTDEKGLIDRAARAIGKNRTDFILDAARAAAQETLLDQVIIAANPQSYTEFLARLDTPSKPNERLRRTIKTSAPWDKK